jgi:hypothetical protein
MRARIVKFCMTLYQNPSVNLQANMQRVREVIIRMILSNTSGLAVAFPTPEEIFSLFKFV